MQKERQKYLTALLDTYCQPMRKRISRFVTVISVTTVLQVLAIAQLTSGLLIDHANFLSYWPWLIVLAVGFVGKAFAVHARSRLTQRLAAQVRTEIRQQIVARTNQLGTKGLAKNSAAMAIFYLEQVDLLNNYLARFYPQNIASRIQPVIILLAVFALNWVAGLILLVTSPLLPIFMILIGIKTSEMNERQLKSLLYLGNQFHDKLVGIRTIISFSQQPKTLKQITASSQGYTETTVNLLKVAFLNSAVLEFLSSICIALMALYFGLSYIEGNATGAYGTAISIFSGFFCLTLAGEFFQPLKDLGAFYHDRSSALNAMDAIDKFINQKVEVNQDYVDVTQQVEPVPAQAQTTAQAQTATQSQTTAQAPTPTQANLLTSAMQKVEDRNLLNSSFDSIDAATNTEGGLKSEQSGSGVDLATQVRPGLRPDSPLGLAVQAAQQQQLAAAQAAQVHLAHLDLVAINQAQAKLAQLQAEQAELEQAQREQADPEKLKLLAKKIKRAKKALAKAYQKPVQLNAKNAPRLPGLRYPFSAPAELASLSLANTSLVTTGKPLFLTKDSLVEAKDLAVFTHDGQCLLAGLNFSWRLGDKIAIVGLSGSGKTTLISVLLGLFPYAGSLSIGGVELSELNLDQYYTYFSWLGQNPNLEQASILENLQYQGKFQENSLHHEPVWLESQVETAEQELKQAQAQLEAFEFKLAHDPEPAVQALVQTHQQQAASAPAPAQASLKGKAKRVVADKQAQLTALKDAVAQAQQALAQAKLDADFAQGLAKSGLSKLSISQAIKLARVDQLIEEKSLSYRIAQHNIGLSGGQVQRLALARALAKPHLQLIIDEPTANLDAKLEQAVFDNLKNHPYGVLMVTHRLSHAECFDRVYELSDQGLIAQEVQKHQEAHHG